MTNFDRSFTRRGFLGKSAAVGGALASLTALGGLGARSALAASGKDVTTKGYGPLAPVAPVNDPTGFEILALPAGFRYVTFSAIGETMSDGNPVPVNHDGMAAFAHPADAGIVRLIRNQEDRGCRLRNGLGLLPLPAERPGRFERRRNAADAGNPKLSAL